MNGDSLGTLLNNDVCWPPKLPSLLKLLCRMGVLTLPAPMPIACAWPNMVRVDSGGANGRWRSTEPVGLRRRLGLLLEGGEPMLACGARLIRVAGSSAPFKEPEAGLFRKMEKRSEPEAAGAALVPDSSSFTPTLKRSLPNGTSGSELVRNSERCAALFSNF